MVRKSSNPTDGSPIMISKSGPAFIDGYIDRNHLQRENEDWLAEQCAREDASFLIVSGDEPVYHNAIDGAPSALLSRQVADVFAPSAEQIFLGIDRQDKPVLARGIDNRVECDGFNQGDLRQLVSDSGLPAGEISLLALARSMLSWHRNHLFCSKCGASSKMKLGGFRRDCPACNAQHFPRTDPVVIALITDGDRVLVARSERFVPGMYSALAGFVEPGETIENAVRREIFEESAIQVGRISYYSSQPWPYPSSLMIGCFGEALTTDITIDPVEIEDAMWVTRDEIQASLAGKGTFRAPQPVAIAHHLFQAYAKFLEPRFT
jgi:NAD+ diphosphatase